MSDTVPEIKVALPEVGHYQWWQLGIVYPIARTLAWLLFLVLGPIRVRGRYRIPARGPVLILSNHIADVDPIVVQLGCKRPIQFMAKSELFVMPVVGRVLRWFRVFPVKRGEPDRAAMRHAIETLKIGEVVAMFPEGQLSETGELQDLKPGVALIVRQAAGEGTLPVICCGVRNTDRVMPYGRVIPRMSWSWVHLNWGEIREFDRHATSEEILDWARNQLRELTN